MEIRLKWDYLKHDIDQWTWRLGDTRKEEGEKRFSSQSDDSLTDDIFLRRKVEEAVSSLRVMLFDRLDHSPGGVDDILDTGVAEWSFPFRDSNRGTDSDSLVKLMHRYVVWYVLWAWCLIYFEEMADRFGRELQSLADSVVLAAYMRKAPRKYKRRPLADVDEVTVDTEE